MADLAIGISKAAVEALVSKVQSAIKEEAEKWRTVQRDLVFITDEFEMMQSFLSSADGERIKNNVVRTWVRQVRNLSYDVEDCIESVLHLDTKKRTWWLQLLPLPSCAKAKAAAEPGLDEAVAEITQLKARVVDVSKRNTRYNLISDSGSKPQPAQPQEIATAASARTFDDILINTTKKKSGLSDDLAGLITLEDKELQVISICGRGGDNGKISIIRKAYSDSRVHKNFKCRAWVKLQHPFSPHEFIRSLVPQFYTNSCDAQRGEVEGVRALAMMEGSQGAYLTQEFVELVNKQKYLVVLEDLCTISQWDAIKTYLPDMNNGSRIVVSTNDLEIASLCPGQPVIVSELWQFSADHPVCIFFKEGFQQYDAVHSFMKEKEEDCHSLCGGLLGRKTQVDELFEEAKKRRLISVWGMPGVGKSELLRAVYDKFDKHTWVNVCHPFNPTDFNRDLLKGLIPNNEDLMKDSRDNLQDSKCLVVIDGLHSKEEWDLIKSDLKKYGDSRTCIIIVTSDESVTKHCAASSNDAVYNIKGLESDPAHELFGKVLKESGSFRVIWTEERKAINAVVEAGRLILPNCGGIPRVIITVARYLASKPKDEFEFDRETRRLSDNFMQELATNPEFDSLRGVLVWMHSYLHVCPRHLKKYMLYLSIFPCDKIIRRRRLIRRWIAEGYFKGTDNISMEKHAEKIFDEVAALTIMQPAVEEKTNKVTGYRVNGLFREYIMSRPVEETIFFPVEVSALEKQGQGGRMTTQGIIGQHLAIGSTWDEDAIVLESLDLSRLRSMTVFGMFWSFYVSDMMRVLRVLDLEDATINFDFQFVDIRKLPSRLKFLSLRGKRIRKLPDSVGDLLLLQTLDIRDTSIVTLPPFITKLRKLQYIRAGTTVAWSSSNRGSRTLASGLPKKKFCRCGGPVVASRSGGVVVPRGIRKLKALHTLGVVSINTAQGDSILDEIVSLPQLKKLQISGISRKHGPLSSFFLLDGKIHLESLSLQFERKNHFIHWEDINIPRSLRSLNMYGHVEQLPWRIKDCDNLEKLALEMTNTLFTAEVIELLGRLTSLRTLRLHVSKDQQHGELRFPFNCFRNLHVLEIACKSMLDVRIDEGAMEKLEQLMVHCLQGSEMRVSGLEHPVSLNKVWLLSSVDNALKEAVQQQLNRHPKIPAPKLEVHLGRQDRNSTPPRNSTPL